MQNVILFELNEVPYQALDYFNEAYPSSTLAEITKLSTQLTGVCPDETELDPWISWPTLHRGVNDAKHRIFHLGQLLDKVDIKYPPIWRMLRDAGISVGVSGSLHSSHIPKDVESYAFYLPDFFDEEAFAHPKSLLPFQKFNLGMTRRSARNVDTGIPRDLVAEFAKSAPSLGLSISTIKEIVGQLLRERVTKHLRIRRRGLQSLLMNDIFVAQMRRFRPQFATLYTNHVAAAMHRYWAAAFPDDPNGSRMPKDWVDKYRPELLEALRVCDQMVAKLKAYADRTDSILLIAGSMGQHAVDNPPARGMITIKDLDKFMGVLGVEPSQFTKRHAMVPCVAAVVDPAAIDRMKARLDSFSINGHAFVESDQEVYPLSYGLYDGGVVSFLAYFDDYDGEMVATVGNETLSFEEAGIGFIAHEDGVSVSGHHTEEGIVLVYNPSSPATDQSRRRVSTTEIAPALLEHFAVPVPDYMAQPTGLLRRALERIRPSSAAA